MTNSPYINRVLFITFLVLTFGVGIAALIWPGFRAIAYAPVRDLLFPNVFLPTRASLPVTLSVVAPPALENWVKTNAVEFTDQNPFIQIRVTQLRGMEAERRLNAITDQVDVWIAETAFARRVAASIPFEVQGQPVAQDKFLLVAARTRNEFVDNLSWKTVAQFAARNPQFKIAMPPVNSIEGMAACWSAAAEYYGSENITDLQINDEAFQTWLTELLQAAPDRNRSPRDQLSTRPPQAEVGLILDSEWSQLGQDIFFSRAPLYNVVFDYPYYIRTTWQNLSADEASAHQEAALKFRAFLLSASAQNKLSAAGLERISSSNADPSPSLNDATIRALQFCWK